MIACVTAHPAVDKACDLLGIKLKKIPYDPNTLRMNVNAIQQMLTSNTIMIYASAPQYPHGAIDNIAEISRIAKRYNIGLHVDCCLGGFVLPFAKKLGYNIPGNAPADFSFLFILSFSSFVFFLLL
jgi:sphinganine-1-phosphate aldolase